MSEARFPETFCSQCGGSFGPGNSGYSHCDDHRRAATSTPGPWRRHSVERYIVCGANGQAVADTEADGIGQEERFANAALIASAPDLYEALTAIQILAHDEADEQHEWSAGDMAEALRSIDRLARAALSKSSPNPDRS